MADESTYEPSAGINYLLGSVPLFVVGAVVPVLLDGDPELWVPLSMALLAVATYLLIVGAVARGVQVARRSASS